MGQLEPAGAIGLGAGERAALVAEEFALGELRGEDGAVETHQRPARRGGSARESFGRRAPCRCRSRRRSARFRRWRRFGRCGCAAPRIARLLPIIRGAWLARGCDRATRRSRGVPACSTSRRRSQAWLTDRSSVDRVERLFEVVERTVPHRFDGRRHRRVGRDHQHLHAEPAALDLADEFEAVHAGHLQIGHDDVDRPLGQSARALRSRWRRWRRRSRRGGARRPRFRGPRRGRRPPARGSGLSGLAVRFMRRLAIACAGI